MKTIRHKQKPWRVAELRQLGRVPDAVLARRTEHTIREVAARREDERIGLPTPPRRWTAEEEALSGKFSDRAVAARLQRHHSVVWAHRRALGIAPLTPAPETRQHSAPRSRSELHPLTFNPDFLKTR